ncbi:MAG: LytR/AlgR family response regulator transcription factor [Saprospiraceae bacterium]
MEHTKILIVEDDPLFALELTRIVEEVGYRVAACFDNALSVLDWLSQSASIPDLALLDISLKGEPDGIGLAERLPGIPIIFITSADVPHIYQRARRLKPHGYIVKPVGKLTLQSIVESALLRGPGPAINSQADYDGQKEQTIQDYLFLKNLKGERTKVEFKEVGFIESDGNYCTIQTKNLNRFVLKISMKRLSNQLPSALFVQIHRNFMINTGMMDNINLSQGTLKVLEKTIPIGLRFRRALLKRLQI